MLDPSSNPEERHTDDTKKSAGTEAQLAKDAAQHPAAAATSQTDKSETAFDQLVLPAGHKKVVLSLVAQHFRNKELVRKGGGGDEEVDIVRGKGKGLIILLHGAPGVGKTSTAGILA